MCKALRGNAFNRIGLDLLDVVLVVESQVS